MAAGRSGSGLAVIGVGIGVRIHFGEEERIERGFLSDRFVRSRQILFTVGPDNGPVGR